MTKKRDTSTVARWLIKRYGARDAINLGYQIYSNVKPSNDLRMRTILHEFDMELGEIMSTRPER